MKYTAEEVLAIAKRLHDDITVADGDALMASDMLTAYADLLERIKADEGVVPDGWAKPEEIESYRRAAAKPRGTNGGGFGVFVSNKPGGIYTLPVYFTHPPAQAAQGEVVDCPECGSRCTYRAISMSDDVIYEYTPAQAAQSVDVEKMHSLEARGWIAEGEENGEYAVTEEGKRVIAARLTQPAQLVDIEAIREVIESHINEAKKLRHDPESQDYLYEQADKLEAALQEKGNG